MTGGFESTHRSFALTRWLMGVLGPIVEAFVLPMLDAAQDVLFRCCVTRQFIGNDDPWDILTPFEELPKELLGGMLISSALDENIQHIAVLINRPPHLMELAIDFEEDFIKMPFVGGLRRASAQLLGIRLTEFPAPLTNRLVRKNYPTCSHEFFHVTIAEAEPVVEPDGVANNLGRKAIRRVRER
jgi:hypothetical protein